METITFTEYLNKILNGNQVAEFTPVEITVAELQRTNNDDWGALHFIHTPTGVPVKFVTIEDCAIARIEILINGHYEGFCDDFIGGLDNYYYDRFDDGEPPTFIVKAGEFYD